MDIDKKLNFKPGNDTWVDSVSPAGVGGVFFEDDGAVAYFYARENTTGPICDALVIYNVAQVSDREEPSTLELGWSSSGLQAALAINGHIHAAFDFERKSGCCRTGSGAGSGDWSADGHAWNDDCLGFFRGQDPG